MKRVVISQVCENIDHPLDVDYPEIWEVSWEDYCWLKQMHEYFTSDKMYGRRSVNVDSLQAIFDRSKRITDYDFSITPLSIDGVFRIETKIE